MSRQVQSVEVITRAIRQELLGGPLRADECAFVFSQIMLRHRIGPRSPNWEMVPAGDWSPRVKAIVQDAANRVQQKYDLPAVPLGLATVDFHV